MTVRTRWQDWAFAAVGLLLVVSPFAFAPSLGSVEAVTAYILGGLVFVLAAGALVFERMKHITEAGELGLAIVLFFTPWLLGFAAVAGMAWTAWIVGLAIVLIVGTEYLAAPRPLATAR